MTLLGGQSGACRSAFRLATLLVEAGFSVVPIRTDGSKAPAWPIWIQFQIHQPDQQTLRKMFFGRTVGLAIIGGSVSGNLEVLDFDAGELFHQWVALVADDLIRNLPVVATPSDGFHVYYRCNSVEGNQKLATSSSGETLIETRGRGGYVVAPGSPPNCHPTGKLYQKHSGPSLLETPTISERDRRLLLESAKSFNEATMEIREPAAHRTPTHGLFYSLTPGDDFALQTSWSEILLPHGWTLVQRTGDHCYWRRPGKRSGHSAISGHRSSQGRELLTVFSSNAHPFQGPSGGKAGTSYNKFNAHALLNHAGDHSAAARELRSRGFGMQLDPWIAEANRRAVRHRRQIIRSAKP